jgi:hypothetical protein
MTELNPNDIIKLTFQNKETITGIIQTITENQLTLRIPPDQEHVIEIVNKKLVDVIAIARLFKAKGYISTHGYKIGNVLTITFEDQTKVKATLVEIEYDMMTINVQDEFLYIDFNYMQSLPDGIIHISLSESEDDVFNFEYVMLDKSKRRYMLDQQLADLLQTMTYTKTPKATLLVHRYKELMMEFPEGDAAQPDQSSFKWVYPTIQDQIQLFVNEKQNEQFKTDMTNILVCYDKKTLTNTDKTLHIIQETLSKLLRPFQHSYKPIIDPKLGSYIIQQSKSLVYVKNKGSKIDDVNWLKKKRSWVGYVTDEKVTTHGFVRLPESSISFSKLYLPETNLADKINLNNISHYHMLHFKCDDSFLKNVPEKPFFSEKNEFVPAIKSLIAKQPVYSMYEFIKNVEPYHIYANHIQHEWIESLPKTINKHIQSYASSLVKSTSISPSQIKIDEEYNKIYISTSEVYNWALSIDFANVFVASHLLASLNKKELPLPDKETPVFKLTPNEPECELRDNCDTQGLETLKQHLLTVHASNTVEPRDIKNISLLKKKLHLAHIKLLKYNNNFIQFVKADPPVLSPYQDKMDRIMQKKISERYSTLLLFIDEYTISSSSAWLLCKTNHSKLVPVFLQTLAQLYVQLDKSEYYARLKDMCKPDHIDNGFYIDIDSGYPIAPIEAAVSYDEEIRSSVLRVDIDHQTTVYTNPQSILSRWLNQLSKYLDIFISQEQMIHIVKNVYNITSSLKPQTHTPLIVLTLLVYVIHTFKDTFQLCSVRTIQMCIEHLKTKWEDFPVLLLLDKSKNPTFNLDKTVQKIMGLIAIKKVEVSHIAPYNWRWTTFMPSVHSMDPVMLKINALIRQQKPIHMLDNRIAKKINTVIVDLDLGKPHYTNPKQYSSYIEKIHFDPPLDLQFNYKLKPIIIPIKVDHKLQHHYQFDDFKFTQKQQLIDELTKNDIYLDWYETNIQCIVNFIYALIHFYSNVSEEQLKSLKKETIPKSNIKLISQSHKEKIDKFIAKYYPDSLQHKIFEGLVDDEDINEILVELKQPLNHINMSGILEYYILVIFNKILQIDTVNIREQKQVIQFFIDQFKIDMNISNYTLEQINDKISIAKSKERELIKQRSHNKNKDEKQLHSLLDQFGLNPELNLQRLRTHNQEAKELRQAQTEQANDNDAGNDGNEFI